MQLISFYFPCLLRPPAIMNCLPLLRLMSHEWPPFTPIDVALIVDFTIVIWGQTRYIRLFKLLLHNHKTPLRLTLFDHDDASMPLWTIYAVTVLIFHSGIQWLGVPVIQIHSCYIELESVSSLFIKWVVTRPA